ncbi:S9 family peptidase [Alkalicoccus urumqiensis]|uniref:Peptidase n=1 Tax=Alkalicoccus urumqiensis TaxID=1548213 RepID=A0A2P6MFF0_ALKUR|nr:S9 family peptidase [Alkalicoccus urumqiensis]PRO65042.1 peptidase [Alkalicoccus urumqiensis]
MQKTAVTKQDLTSYHLLQHPAYSPDGTRFAFIRRRIEDDGYSSQLFVQEEGELLPRQWTFGSGEAASPAFSPDGKWIAYTYKKDGKPQLYRIPVHGGEAEKLTDLPGGCSAPFWHPDSGSVLFTTSVVPDTGEMDDREETDPLVITSVRHKSDAAGFLTNDRRQLARYDFAAASPTILTQSDHDLTLMDWNGTSILYLANREDAPRVGQDVYLYHPEEEKEELLLRGGFSGASFSPDGRSVAATGSDQAFDGATQDDIWLVDLQTQQSINLTAEVDMPFSDAMIADVQPVGGSTPVWAPDSRSVFVRASHHGETNVYQIPLEGPMEPVTTGAHHVFSHVVNPSSGQLTCGIASPVHPGEWYDVENGRPEAKTDFHSRYVEETELAEPTEHWVERDDGTLVHGWLLSNGTSGRPGILEIHGGPHAMYGAAFFHELQLLAAEGYAVFYANPRGSHGYGQAFVNAVRGDYGGEDYQDLMAFTDSILREHPWVDASRLGVTGGSYGGFMTNWITAHTDRFKAAATLRCISNWTSFYGVSDIGWFFTDWEIGTTFLEDPDTLWHHSPLKYVRQIKTPMLILHGEQDLRCPIEQAEQLFTALKMDGRDVRFVRFPKANHELSRSGPPALRRARLRELTDWFTEKL